MLLAKLKSLVFPDRPSAIIPGFDAEYYGRTYPDVATSGLSPAEHYRRIGRAEHRDPNAHFDAKAYLSAHPDVAVAGFEPLSHFMVHGLAQNYDGWRRTRSGHAGKGALAAAYRVPDDLTVTAAGPETILVVGSCLVENLVAEFARTKPVQGDFVLVNFASRLPEAPPRGLDGYDLQIVQLALRSILPDNGFAHLQFHRPDDYQGSCASNRARFFRERRSWRPSISASHRWRSPSPETAAFAAPSNSSTRPTSSIPPADAGPWRRYRLRCVTG